MSDVQHVDHDTLAGLREVMEDDFSQLIETYIADSLARLASLQQALVADDCDAMRRAAHSFKGSCSNIGAALLVSLCQDIEQAAAEGSLSGLECRLVELQSEFYQVQRQLEAYR